MKVLGAARTYGSVYVKMLKLQDVIKVRTEIKEARAQRLHANIVHLMNMFSIE
jgi:hypothetical protein